MDSPKQIRLPEPGSLIVSSSPHVHNPADTRKIMLQVLLCLLPCELAAIWYFGLRALAVTVECTVFCMFFEYVWNKMMRQPVAIWDFSAAVTGVILAMNLPPTVPVWLCAVGSFIAIIIAKQVFGGLGQNPFNPAAVARVALLVGFAGQMSSQWIKPEGGRILRWADAVTTATPCTEAKMAAGNIAKIHALENMELYGDYFFGNMTGSLGEISTLAILIGFAGLLIFHLIRWEIPVSIIITVAVFTGFVNLISPATTPGPFYHLLTGGVMFGAVFMATDMVTSPLTLRGGIIFGAGIGIISCIIRIWGAYPEGMSFSIILMNALVPLIDRLCYSRPFGWFPTYGGKR